MLFFLVFHLFLKELLVLELFCFVLADNSKAPTDGGKLSSRQIAFITVSAVVGCVVALFAIYVIR